VENRVEGNARASNIAASRPESVETARHIAKARKADHLIRDAAGRVAERGSHRPG
jgi:hypothetical protein